MTPVHQPLYRLIMRIQWLFIGIIAIVQVSHILFNGLQSPAVLISLALLAVVAAMAPLVGRIKSPAGRCACALLEFFLCTAARCFGDQSIYPVLFITLLARYSMLVNVPMVVVMIGLVGTIDNHFAFAAIRTVVLNWAQMPSAPLVDDRQLAFVSRFSIYISALILVVIAIRYLNIEQDLRKQAQHLMLEIKDMATELERTRLAREIHDSLGHSLTALNMQLEVFATLHETDPQKAMGAFHTARQLAASILNDVRAVVHSIRHQDFDFETNLRSLVEQSQQLKGVDIKLDLNVKDLPQSSAYQLYNIARECMTNSLKHASPHNMHISVREELDQIVLECSDDGNGFDAKTRNGNGYGLRGMKERAESLGGTLAVESEIGQGTKVWVRLPQVQQLNDSHPNS